jgi:CheY-like chemotaxis protein
MLEMALAQTGGPVDITILEDGAKAIEYLTGNPNHRCDVVLLDLNLPRVGGFEVLQRIRTTEHLKGLPIVVLSGSTNVEEIDRCYRAGANSYICKPIQLDEIFGTAARFVAYWSKCVQPPSRRQGSSSPLLRAAAHPH